MRSGGEAEVSVYADGVGMGENLDLGPSGVEGGCITEVGSITQFPDSQLILTDELATGPRAKCFSC